MIYVRASTKSGDGFYLPQMVARNVQTRSVVPGIALERVGVAKTTVPLGQARRP